MDETADERGSDAPGDDGAGTGEPDAPERAPAAEERQSSLAGFMSVPIHRRLPLRRSTGLMVVAFAGFATLLYLYPPDSTPAPSHVTVPVATSTTTTVPPTTTTTTRPTTTTTSSGQTTTTGGSSGSSTTTTGRSGGAGTTTTTTLVGQGTGSTSTSTVSGPGAQSGSTTSTTGP